MPRADKNKDIHSEGNQVCDLGRAIQHMHGITAVSCSSAHKRVTLGQDTDQCARPFHCFQKQAKLWQMSRIDEGGIALQHPSPSHCRAKPDDAISKLNKTTKLKHV